jgi:glycosyltransferase involved in cell wall biosynthesis
VVPGQDTEALRLALSSLLNDPGKSRALGDAARAHCAARYSYEVMLDKMEAIYRQAAGQR